MPKIKVSINKTNKAKIDKFLKAFPDAPESFKEELEAQIINDIRNIRDCTEKSIVEAYLKVARPGMDWANIIETARNILVKKYTEKEHFDNIIDIYFNDVKREYIRHPMNESNSLDFTLDNREIFIKNNLKLVIECAKRYRNLGLPFEDLIQAGNIGLVRSFERFDTERNKLQKTIFELIEDSDKEEFDLVDAKAIIKKAYSYDKNGSLDKTLAKVPNEGFESKDAFIKWVKKNINKAVFASVAFQWIRADIMSELGHYGNIIKVTKSGENTVPTTIIRLDSINPHTEDNYHDNQIADVANEEFLMEDQRLENEEKAAMFSEIVNKALKDMDCTSVRLVKKRFGIGLPYQLTVNELAENEGISSSKVKYVLNGALEEIRRNISDKDKELLLELLG